MNLAWAWCKGLDIVFWLFSESKTALVYPTVTVFVKLHDEPGCYGSPPRSVFCFEEIFERLD